MAHVSHKITEFPARSDRVPPKASATTDFPEDDREPPRGARSAIEELEIAVRDARRNQRLAEDECDRLRSTLSEFTDGAGDIDVKTLTRERDMLREQQSQYGPVISELKVKLKTAETESQAAQREREEEATALKRALREKEDALTGAENTKRKRDEAIRQRDSAVRQRDLAREEKEAAIEKVAAAEKNFSEAQRALADLRKELGSAKKGDGELGQQLATLRQARDGMAAQIKELQRKLDELEDQAAELTYTREAAEKESRTLAGELQAVQAAATANEAGSQKVADLEALIDELKQENAALTQSSASFSDGGQRTIAELQEIRGRLDAVVQERAAAALALDEARASLLAAQQEIEATVGDGETLRQQLSEGMAALDAQLREQAAEIGRLKNELSHAESRLSERQVLGEQFEKRRLDMIELTAQLSNAHREIRNLSASLAEARLLAKVAGKKVAVPASTSGSGNDSDSNAAEKDGILGLRRCFQSFNCEPERLGLLDELKSRAQSLADAGRDQGRPILHRVSAAFVTLLTDMRQIPEQISQGTLRTVNQTIELIASLVADPGIEQSVALDNARAYVVDDDPATCATVVDALNMVGLKAGYALDSSAAVAELPGNRCDLIILDVHMPDLDGFELCAHIRNMAFHAETPVFFISGNTSLENRVKSSLRGGNEFIAKPFSIQELALKALKSVISVQLQAR